MRVTAFASGSGTNLERILEFKSEFRDPPFMVQAIVSDWPNPRTAEIAVKHEVPHIVYDFGEYCMARGTEPGKDLRDNPSIRASYFSMVLEDRHVRNSDIFILAGFMLLIPKEALVPGNVFINVHPADLSVRDSDGRAIYTGSNAVRKAILMGATELRSTVHLVTQEVDQGPPMLISKPIPVTLPHGMTLEDLRLAENRGVLNKVALDHQSLLKAEGDWIIFPRAVFETARGHFALDGGAMQYWNGYRWMPIPRGYDISTEAPR